MKLLVIFIIVTVAVGLFLLTRRRSGSHFAELVVMCRGDRQQAQRMVDGQKRRNPDISEDEAARRAVVAWRRELR